MINKLILGYQFVGKLRWQVTNWIGNWDLPPADTKHFWLLRLAKRVLMSSYQTSHWKHLPSFTRPPDTSQYTWGPASRARDQGVVAKNLVHSNADQTSHWICILRTCHRNRHSCHVWNRLKQHHNLSPGAKTLCSAHHKQNPSELKVDSSPLNHQRTRDFQPQKQSRDFLILCFFSVRKHPLLPRSRIHPEGFESSRIQNRHVVGGGPRYYHSGWRLSFLGPAMVGGV